jgi:hypothetical protein
MAGRRKRSDSRLPSDLRSSVEWISQIDIRVLFRPSDRVAAAGYWRLQAPVLLRFAARDYQRKTKFLKGLRGPRHHSLRRRRQLRLAGVRTTALGLEVNAIGNLEKKMSSLLKM